MSGLFTNTETGTRKHSGNEVHGILGGQFMQISLQCKFLIVNCHIANLYK